MQTKSCHVIFIDCQMPELYSTPEVTPREGTRPTTPCRPGPLTRRCELMSLCIDPHCFKTSEAVPGGKSDVIAAFLAMMKICWSKQSSIQASEPMKKANQGEGLAASGCDWKWASRSGDRAFEMKRTSNLEHRTQNVENPSQKPQRFAFSDFKVRSSAFKVRCSSSLPRLSLRLLPPSGSALL